MGGPPIQPPAAPPTPPRLPARLASELDPDIDPDFPDVEEVDVHGVALSFPDARTLTVVRSKLTACEIDDADETALDATDSFLVDLDLTARTVASLTRVVLVRCRLGGADFGDAKLVDVHFDGCVLDLASMRGARLERVLLGGGRVDGLDLSGARLTDTTVVGLPLGEVTLEGTRLERVDLTEAQLDDVIEVGTIRGATISEAQAMALSVRLARAAGMSIAPRP